MSATDDATVGRVDLKSTSYEFVILATAILSIANIPLLLILPYQSQSWYLGMLVEGAVTLVRLGLQ